MADEPSEPPYDVDSITLLGVRIHRVDTAAAMGVLRRFAADDKPHIVVTADASGVSLAQRDREFLEIVNSADLVTPDGAGVLWAARRSGTPLVERVSGVDIARDLCRIAAEDGISVYLLGAAPGVAEKAAQNLVRQCPGLSIAGTHDGFFSENESPAIAAQIKASGAKVLLVAMGIPRQEKWLRDHVAETGVGLGIGVGGSFDVFSGNVRRAPLWMQRHGLEWLFRLATNPRRISKVAELPRFAWMVLSRRPNRASGSDHWTNPQSKGSA